MSKETVLVTGAGGFIGSHLVEALLARGNHVRALVHYNSRSDRGWLADIGRPDGLEIHFGDVRDASQMRGLVEGCQVVYHLAALIGIPYSYAAASSYIETNVVGTLNMLEAAKAAGVRRFVHTSTSEAYGTALYTPIDENHPLQAQSPYSASKISADKVAESYHRSFGLPVVTVRPFNTYGPRQSARAVIPTIITQALAGPEIKLGSLDPRRDLTFVSDTVDGFIAAAETEGTEGELINLGTGSAASIGQLAEMIVTLVGGKHQIVCDEQRIRPGASEVGELLSNNTRAHKLIGWTPQVTLEEGLAKTIAWIKDHRDFFEAGSYAV